LITFGYDETNFRLPASCEYTLHRMGLAHKIGCILRYIKLYLSTEMLIGKES